MKRIWVILAVLIAMVTGCSKKAVIKPDMQENASGKQEQKLDAAGQKKPDTIPAIPVEAVDSQNAVPAKTAVRDNMFNDILFDYDRYEVKETAKPILRDVSGWLSKHPEARVSIEGHCDERGTNEYNLALGDRRAKAVREFLLSMGVASKKTDTISYGEERPLCKESTADCWARNRRAHFAIAGAPAAPQNK